MALPEQTSLLRRVIVAVALAGVLVVTHLGLQQANGFANGCTGLAGIAFSADDIGTETAGCAAVTGSEWANMFGVSNVVWGLLFYGLVLALRLGYAAFRDDRLRLASAGVVGVGVLYTAFLVYIQAVQIGSFCVLCMTSAALVLTLAVLHAVEHRRLGSGLAAPPRRRAGPERTGLGALRPYAPLLAVFAVLLVADLAWARQSDAPAGSTDAVRQLTRTTAAGLQPARNETGTCDYDPSYDPIADLAPFTDGPFRGDPDAPVAVVKVFDPNCPHCKELSETIDPVAEELGDRARFYYVPYPLRQQSLGQIIALKLAEREGRFFELMDEMFRRQDQTWGMSLEELVETVDAVGMDGAAFQAVVEDADRLQPLLAQIEADAEAVADAFTNRDGGIGVPKLAVDGRVVAATYSSYSARCLAEFVAEAEAADVGAEAEPAVN